MAEKKILTLAQSFINAASGRVAEATTTGVVTDWHNEFPDLVRLKKGNKLLKIVGPIAMGIELEKSSSVEYRPQIVLYNLLKSKKSLACVFRQFLTGKNGLFRTIAYVNHDSEYLNASIALKKQSLIALEGDVSIEDIIAALIAFVESSKTSDVFGACETVLQLSRVTSIVETSDLYFKKGLLLLNTKLSPFQIEYFTRSSPVWLDEIAALDLKKIRDLTKESIERIGLTAIPNHPV